MSSAADSCAADSRRGPIRSELVVFMLPMQKKGEYRYDTRLPFMSARGALILRRAPAHAVTLASRHGAG